MFYMFFVFIVEKRFITWCARSAKGKKVVKIFIYTLNHTLNKILKAVETLFNQDIDNLSN